MTIRCQCPECGITLKIKDELGGKPGKCPQCHVAFTIPKPEAEEEHLSLDDHHDDHHDVVHEASGSKIKRRERAEERPEPPKDDEYEPPGSAANTAMNLLKQSDEDDHPAPERKVGGDKRAGEDRKSGESKAAGKKKGMAFGKGGRDESGDGFDTKETLKNFAVTVLPRALVALVLVYVAYWLSSTLMSGGGDRPALGQVSGVVTLDGAPLANAVITFRPEAGEQAGSKVSFSMARTTSEGKYALLYVQGILGAAIGNHRVEIRAQNETGAERVPAKYNNRTELIREVKAGVNPMDFALTSK